MNRCRGRITAVIAVIAVVFLPVNAAWAYGGPGSVVTGIGALFAAVAALFAALFGFIWFPLKKIIGKFSSDNRDETTKSKGS